MEFSSNVRQTRARRDPELRPAIPSGTRQQMSARWSVVGSRVVSVAQRTPQIRCPRPRITPYSRVSNRREGSEHESSNTTRIGSPILPCTVCFNDMHPKWGVHLSTLPCGHAFCTSCIKKWVNVKSICPTCMRRFEGCEMKPLYL